jgi:hypothetical protein
MTATEVDGLAVVDDQPTPAVMKDAAGQTIYFQQTRMLTLADGDVVYGCQHCDYVSDNWRSIRPHLRVHNGAPSTANYLPPAVRNAITNITKTQRQAQEAASWRDRALRAEKALDAMNKALGVTE